MENTAIKWKLNKFNPKCTTNYALTLKNYEKHSDIRGIFQR